MEKTISILPLKPGQKEEKFKFTVNSDFRTSFMKDLPNKKTKLSLFEHRLQNPTRGAQEMFKKNKATYYKKDQLETQKSIQAGRKNSFLGGNLELKSALSKKYKKLKSPTQEQSNLKRLEKAFRAIANSGNSINTSEQAQNIHNVSIKLGDFKNFLNRRYPKKIGEIILNYIKFNGNTMKFQQYCDMMEKFMALPDDEKYLICFDFFDQDNDKKISTSDIFTFMHHVKETDVLNMNDCDVLMKTIKENSVQKASKMNQTL
ncbi:unnamed protein product [Moneuplotes crassus]|uniref:EF-hand domain-containing protein n=1 Tax=Euplotes crassus TaxID=5936 RepID=A0AAD1UJ94_EUPCR|nr:unnamed protein product [Moneuplotes crassus]